MPPLPAPPRSGPVQWARMGFEVEALPARAVPSSPHLKYAAFNAGPRPQPAPFRNRVLLLAPLAFIAVLFLAAAGRDTLARYGVFNRVAKGEDSYADTYKYATPSPEYEAYQQHPIVTLMAQAKRNWAEKVKRQSRSYEEAVKEYRRRYSREPPRGFRAWYDYAKLHKVTLIDEYDHLSNNLAPFYAIPSAELAKRIAHMRASSANHAFLSIRNGKQLPWTGATWRRILCDFFSENIADFSALLPDLDVALFMHDGPATFLDAEAMAAHLKASSSGTYVNESVLHLGETNNEWDVRARTCLPNSPLRRAQMGLDHVKELGPSFIQKHVESMDYCNQPENLLLHGSTYFTPYLGRIEPTFTLSKTSINSDFLWPAPIQYSLNPPGEIAFAEKPRHKLVWRGSPDGVSVEPSKAWRHTHRFRAIFLTNSNDTLETRKVRMTRRDVLGREYQVDEDHTLAELNERYMDVRPTQHAVQCSELCEYIQGLLPFAPKASLEEMSQNRYVLDIDGNAYSARFRTHLLSNQVPLKSTRYPEWYSGQIEPWLHYVPLKQDYSDLYNILAFFDGDLSPQRVGNHDELAEVIAVEGREWAETHWRTEDMKTYMFRLLLEYARVMDPERDARGDLLSDSPGHA